MTSKTWPILTVVAGCLLVLTAVFGLQAFRRAGEIYAESAALHATLQRSENALFEIQAEIHLSEIFVRDYLLDPSHIAAEFYREQLLMMRSSMQAHLDELERLVGAEDAGEMRRLHAELDSYWDSLEPLFNWTPQQKQAVSSLFLRRTVLPRRNAVLAMAREVRRLTDAHAGRQRAALDRSRDRFRDTLWKTLAVAISLGLLVTVAGTLRMARLEGRASMQRRRAEQAEQELRGLSQQLVQAQEEERKAISRELHDEVGQMLTALKVELGNLDPLREGPREQFESYLAETKRLCEDSLRSVREISMGLRPSMLDDLGLEPALNWQAREFSRRYGVPVTVEVDGQLDRLPEPHRTCVYRVVQEALTNCARHAQANSIRIVTHGERNGLTLTIQDDGVGFETLRSRGKGLGLIGIEERVRELGGKVTIYSQPSRGSVLTANIPLLQKTTA